MMLLWLKTIWASFPLLSNLVNFCLVKCLIRHSVLSIWALLGSCWFEEVSFKILFLDMVRFPQNVMWLWVQSKVTFIEQKFCNWMWSNFFLPYYLCSSGSSRSFLYLKPSSTNYISLSSSKSLFLTSVCDVWYRSNSPFSLYWKFSLCGEFLYRDFPYWFVVPLNIN